MNKKKIISSILFVVFIVIVVAIFIVSSKINEKITELPSNIESIPKPDPEAIKEIQPTEEDLAGKETPEHKYIYKIVFYSNKSLESLDKIGESVKSIDKNLESTLKTELANISYLYSELDSLETTTDALRESHEYYKETCLVHLKNAVDDMLLGIKNYDKTKVNIVVGHIDKFYQSTNEYTENFIKNMQ